MEKAGDELQEDMELTAMRKPPVLPSAKSV